MRKASIKKWIVRSLLLFGCMLLLYPTMSNLWNRYMASRVIFSYSAETEQLDREQEESIINQALQYNRRLVSDQEEIFLCAQESQSYRKQLWLDENGMMGYLEIPSIHVSLPIYHGTEEAVLQEGVGHLDWSSLPIEGESTHSVLSGHRGLPRAKLFTDLDRLAEGDRFFLHVLGKVLTYEVDRIQIIEPNEIEALKIVPQKNFCTLMTCTPYGINTQRLLVRGFLADTQPEQEQGAAVQEKAKVRPWLWIFIPTSAFALWWFGKLLTERRKSR